MGRTGFFGRLSAGASGVAGAFAAIALVVSVISPHPPIVLDTVPMRLLLALAAVGSVAVAWRFWSAGASQAGPGLSGSPLFGRHAAPPAERRWPGAALILVPVFALGLVGLDLYERGAASPPPVAEAPPSELPPGPLDTPPPELAAKPEPSEPAEPAKPPQEVAIVPPAQPEAPKPAEPIEPSEPPAEVAVAPPQTVAPPVPPEPELPSMPEGHRDAVVWLDLSPNRRYLLSASTDRTIKLWDVKERRLLRTLGEQKDMARTALFLPDGTSAVTCGDDGEIVLRSVADGTILHVFDGRSHGGANKLAVSADGRIAVSGHETGTVIVWDLVSKSALDVMRGHDWTISGVAVSPDGTRAVSGDIDGTLKLWDVATGKMVRSWHGHERGVYGVLFTADGRQLVTGSGDYAIKLWDLETYRELRRFDGHSGTVYALALSKDGRRLMSSSLDGTARIWDFDSGRELASVDPMTGPIYSIAFGTDGEIITGGYDRTIRFWPAAGGDMLALLPGAAP